MSATLGGLIKDFRLQKDLSQLEIAFALGWKEPSRLSRIEQGRVGNPKRKLLDRLMDVMKLTEEERNRLMFVGNYVPTGTEISKATRRAAAVVGKWKYPAIMYDYLWRIVDENTHARRIMQTERILGKRSAKAYPHVLELLFHPDFPQNKLRSGAEEVVWREGLLHLLINFRHVHASRTKERWYMDLVARMMNNQLFRDLWNDSQDKKVASTLTNFMAKTLIDPATTKNKLSFNVFFVPMREDARFSVELYTPADTSTMKVFV